MPVLISLAVVDIMDAFFFYESNLAPRERKEAGIMPSAVRGAASPWFTLRNLLVEKYVHSEPIVRIFRLQLVDHGQTNSGQRAQRG
jgi:hypothetical protein